jgi:uncharacterized protein (DUF1778 family)
MATEAHIKANIKYNRSRDAITLRIPKEDGAQIRQAAQDAGQSVTAYIMQAVREYMDK